MSEPKTSIPPHEEIGQSAEIASHRETEVADDLPLQLKLNPHYATHRDYFYGLIVWLKQYNKSTGYRGNAEILVQRMFAVIGKGRIFQYKYAGRMTMEEMRTHIHTLIDSLPDPDKDGLTLVMLWQQRAVLDELRPYLRRIRFQPRSNAPAITRRGRNHKSWRWLSTGGY